MIESEQRALLERAREGDAAAFAELFAAYEETVKRACRRLLVGDEAGVEDASSEVFLRARRSLDDYDLERPFRPWLLGIAGHHCIDQLRRRKTEARIFDDSDFDEGTLRSNGPTPLSQVVYAERRSELNRAIDALPERYRVPLMLRYFSDMGYREIAEILDVSSAQIGTLLFRAKRKLREALASEGSR